MIKDKQATSRQRQIYFIVFGFMQTFEPLCLSRPESLQVVGALRACRLPRMKDTFALIKQYLISVKVKFVYK